MKLKKVKQDILRVTGNFILFYAVNVLCKSLRITEVNKEVIESLEQKKQNYVVAFWHGTMLLPWYLNSDKKIAALISKSKDGDLLSKILKKWNYEVVRGSSSSGGDTALKLMFDYAKNNFVIAVTPDGPRGPKRKMKAGAVITSKKSGIPVVLLGIGIEKKRKLKSWDEFEVPKFFTRINAVYSDPVYVDKDLTYEQTSKIIKNCENLLNELQQRAEKF